MVFGMSSSKKVTLLSAVKRGKMIEMYAKE
jgi:hypothetical protein